MMPGQFAFPGGMSYADQGSGGMNIGPNGIEMTKASDLEPGKPYPKSLLGSLPPPMRGSADINVTFDNMPQGAKATVKSSQGITPSVNIYHSESLSSGINP